MGWSFRIARVRGIDIRVHATFALILVWAAYFWGFSIDAGWRGATFGVVATVLLFVCVTLHELGHSFVALRYGIPVRDITLLPIGGVASLEGTPEDPGQEFRIAIAGPLVNVAIAAVLIVAGAILQATSLLSPSHLDTSMRDADWSSILAYLTLANIWLVLFNIIPAFPMDGGRIFRSALATRVGFRRATEVAVNLGQGIALLFGLLGFLTGNFFLIFIAVFVWIGAEAEGRQTVARSVLGGITVGDAMTWHPQVLAPIDPATRAIELTLSSAQSDFPVVDTTGRAVGLLTLDDLVRGLQRQPTATVDALMQREVPLAMPAEPLIDAQERLNAKGIRALPVVDNNGHVVGLLSLADVGEAFRLLSIRPDLLSTRRAAA
ncbi:MAG: site-2 protease family protein [Thermomicrobiales bacterium]